MNMNRTIVFVVLLMLVFSSMSFAAAATIFVNSSAGSCGFPGTDHNTALSIQAAITNLTEATKGASGQISSTKAVPHLIVVCRNGTAAHKENVRVNLSNSPTGANITITGNESGVLIQPYDSALPIFNISNNTQITITNFTLAGPGGTNGNVGLILVGNLSGSNHSASQLNVTIENNTFSGAQIGITVIGNNTVIRNNTFLSNVSIGIVLGGPTSLHLNGTANHINITQNTFVGNRSSILNSAEASAAIRIMGGSSFLNITNNSISNYTFGIYMDYLNTSSYVFQSQDLVNISITGVLGTAASSATYRPNVIFNNTYGIYLNRTEFVSVRYNDLFNNTYGVVLELANNSNISDNTFTNGVTAIYVSGHKNNLTGNNITNVTSTGILVNNFPTLGSADAAGSNNSLNTTISGGFINLFTGSSPVGIRIGSSTGNPFNSGNLTYGVNITKGNITSGKSDGGPASIVSGSIGIDTGNGRSINVFDTNLTYLVKGISRTAQLGDTPGDDYVVLHGVRISNTTYGVYVSDEGTVSLNLSRFNITNSTFINNSYAGVYVQGFRVYAGGLLINFNNISSNKFGVILNATSNVTMDGNRIENNTNVSGSDGYGVYFNAVNNSLVSNNSLFGNGVSQIHLTGSLDNVLRNNNMTNASLITRSFLAITGSSNRNNISGTSGTAVTGAGFMQINNSAVTGILVNNSHNTNISHVSLNMSMLTVAPAAQGIAFTGGVNLTVTGVNVTRFIYGILVDGTTVATSRPWVLNSEFVNNTVGALFISTANINLNDSNFHNNTNEGANVTNSSTITIARNGFNTTNIDGLSLNAVTNATVLQNNLNSSEFGVRLINSLAVNMSNNNITNNTYGVNLVNTYVSAFANNNLTFERVSSSTKRVYGLLLNSSSNLTFTAGNSIWMDMADAHAIEIYLQNSQMTTFSGISFNISTNNLTFALNLTSNVSIKVVNLTASVNTSVIRISVPLSPLGEKERLVNGTLVETLLSNGSRSIQGMGLNVSNTTPNAYGAVSPIFYYNGTTAKNLSNGTIPTIDNAATVEPLLTTLGENWSSFYTSAGADRTMNITFIKEGTILTNSYIIPIAFIRVPLNVTASVADTSTDTKKVVPAGTKVEPVVTAEETAAGGAVDTAAAAVADAIAAGKDVTAALKKLNDAKKAFEAGDFELAKLLAEEAATLAESAPAEAAPPDKGQPPVEKPPEIATQEDASSGASVASSAIEEALNSGASGPELEQAKQKLEEAKAAAAAGDFEKALKLAFEAEQLAKAAKQKATAPTKGTTSVLPSTKPKPSESKPAAAGFDFTMLLVAVVVIVVIGVGIYYFTKGGKGGKGQYKGFKR